MKRRRNKDVFISGPPGSGKSTLIARAITIVKQNKCKVAGFIAPEIRSGRERIGFKIIDLASGEEWCLAKKTIESSIMVGRYGVCLEDLYRASQIISKSLDNADFYFLDEIGPMELASPTLKQVIINILGREAPVTGVVHRRLRYSNPSVFRLIQSRGDILWLTRENRSVVSEKYLAWITVRASEACRNKRG